MERLLTGIQPTGNLHIGNYLGSIKQIVDLQNNYESYVMVADLHALTIPQDPKTYGDQILNVVATLIASGLDQEKTTLFIQSAIPEHTILSWIFSTLTPIAELERMTQFKEKSDKHGQNVGLLTYPVLQAADILLYHPEVVPVGEDQVQHLELTRMLVRKFNNKYGQTFAEPKTLLTKTARIMALNDPTKKMSKSVSGSAINIDDNPDQIRRAIMSAVTDTIPTPGVGMSGGVKNLFLLLGAFAPDLFGAFEKQHASGAIKYIDLKTALADAIITTLLPIQEKKKELLENRENIVRILEQGNKKAKQIATKTMIEVNQQIGFIGSSLDKLNDLTNK